MHVSIIVAVTENGVIGREGKLPWHLPADLDRFKRLTMGHTIVMGRRTWESIARQLPGRRMIVVSRQADYRMNVGGIVVAKSLNEALRIAEAAGDTEAFVIGGSELFREALPQADRAFVTRVRTEVAGDTFLPEVNWADWQLVESESHGADNRNEHPFDFQTYERMSAMPR